MEKSYLQQIKNSQITKVCTDLLLMEAEGTGIDKVYESLLSNGKELSYNKVRGTIYKMVEKGILYRDGDRNKAKYLLDQNS